MKSHCEESFRLLGQQGWQILENFFTEDECQLFYSELKALEKESRLKKARVGKKDSKELKPQVRLTQIYWINNLKPTDVQKVFLNKIFSLLEKLKKTTFIPLNTLETHYSIYPPGGFYDRHIDQFKGDTSRQISFILYLNPLWSNGDGGELVIYNEKNPQKTDAVVTPQWGRLVLFLSESIEHEVLPTRKRRYSLTGWMRRAEIQEDPLSIVR